MTAADFNGDGKLDLAVADYHTQKVSILLGNGLGGFAAPVSYDTGANPSSVVSADFNGDGKLDLALASTPLNGSQGNLVSLLLGKGDGTFGTPALFGTGSQAYSLVVGDFDQGGVADLAVANGYSNTVTVLLNTQGTKIGFTTSGSPSIAGQSVTFTATVAASIAQAGSPTGSVTFMNGSTVLGSGTLTGGTASASTSSLPAGSDTISAVYSGDSHFQPHTVTLVQTVMPKPDFSLAASALTPSPVAAGSSTTSTVTITPTNGFDPTTVTFTCSITPAASPAPACSVGTIAVANGVGTATLTVTTTGPTAALVPASGLHPSGMALTFGLLIPAILLGATGRGTGQRRKLLACCAIMLVLGGCMFQAACGGGNGNGGGNHGSSGTPSGSYTVTVTGTGNGTTHPTTPSTLTFSVQ